MGKRGNDMSQLSKEDYEAAMANGSSTVGNGFVKASSDVLKGRRILRTNSKWKKSKAAAASASASSASASSLGGPNAGAATANPFSNFSFTKASTSTSLTAPSIAAKAQSNSLEGGSSKPAFVMPSLPTNRASNSNKTLSLSESLLSSKSSTQQSSGDQRNNSLLADGMKEFIVKQDIRADWSLAMSRYINTYNIVKGSKQSGTSSSTAIANSSTATTSTTSTFGAFGGTTGSLTNSATSTSSIPSKPLFPPVTNAPAPALFSFGSASSGSSTTQKPTFSFGNPATSSPAPAPSSATGFGFAFGGKTSSTGSASTPISSTNPSEQENQESANKNEEDGSSTLQSADNDWNQRYSTKVKVYHHRDKSAGATSFASGELKLQELKSDTSIKRMVMRDVSGKVTLNVSISSSMRFTATRSPRRNGKTLARVQFFGIREVGHDPEMITLVCKPELLDEFHGKLIEMIS